jgi:hypothetical protein
MTESPDEYTSIQFTAIRLEINGNGMEPAIICLRREGEG